MVKRLAVPCPLLDAIIFLRFTFCGFWKTEHQMKARTKFREMTVVQKKWHQPFRLKLIHHHLLMMAIHQQHFLKPWGEKKNSLSQEINCNGELQISRRKIVLTDWETPTENCLQNLQQRRGTYFQLYTLYSSSLIWINFTKGTFHIIILKLSNSEILRSFKSLKSENVWCTKHYISSIENCIWKPE